MPPGPHQALAAGPGRALWIMAAPYRSPAPTSDVARAPLPRRPRWFHTV